MNQKAEVIAYHGWGFEGEIWDLWQTYLEPGYRLKKFNRGYFGSENNLEFEKDSFKKIIFTHSFGLHLCPVEQFDQADLLIIFSGFGTFHPHAPQFKKRSRYIVGQMLKKFRKNPGEVVEAFKQNCYFPEPYSKDENDDMNTKKLEKDLQALNDSQIDIENLKKVPRICILHGAKDTIVPKTKGRILFDKLKDRSQYFEIKEAGHALPFTHTQKCWSFLKPEFESLINN